VRRDDRIRRPERDEADEVRFGPRHPNGRWRPGWPLIACGVVLAAVVAVAVIGDGNKAPRARPEGAGEVGPRLLGLRANWELFGYGPGWVVRIQFASGRITRTAVPPVLSSGPVAFVVGPHQVIIRPLDFVPGYLVPDGRPARLLTGVLGSGGTVIPGPQPGTAWVQAGFQTTSMPLVRIDGTKTGVVLRLPPGGPRLAIPDGGGYVLVGAGDPGGMYDVRPGGFHRIAGMLAAVGPTRWLVVDCHAGDSCSNVVLDQAGGAPHILPGRAAAPEPGADPGVIAPDGSTAAVMRVSGDQVTLHLLSLVSGADRQIPVPLDQESAADQTLAWSPDSRWLFIVAAHGELAAVNTRTLHVDGLGVGLPPISQVAIRNLPSG
jgi:hypothetical protein